MKGKFHIIVRNKRVHYEFDIKRNITIIRGDSGSGKTTLVNMIDLYANRGPGSGIELSCSKNCRTLPAADWQVILPYLHDQILFLDEENDYIKTQQFASAVRKSDNYFVIVTREDLPNLPYSVDEIYGIHTSGKYHDLKRTYHEFYRIYGSRFHPDRKDDGSLQVPDTLHPDTVITEDSNSGFAFFEHVCKNAGISCRSASGKSNLKKTLSEADGKNVLGIADGAAIGPEMNELFQMIRKHPDIRLFLPESFEWLILRSGLIDGNEIRDILDHPEDYADSTDYFSWEQFFTKLLSDRTRGTYLQYQKSSLNPVYLQEKELCAILDQMPIVSFS